MRRRRWEKIKRGKGGHASQFAHDDGREESSEGGEKEREPKKIDLGRKRAGIHQLVAYSFRLLVKLSHKLQKRK